MNSDLNAIVSAALANGWDFDVRSLPEYNTEYDFKRNGIKIKVMLNRQDEMRGAMFYKTYITNAIATDFTNERIELIRWLEAKR